MLRLAHFINGLGLILLLNCLRFRIRACYLTSQLIEHGLFQCGREPDMEAFNVLVGLPFDLFLTLSYLWSARPISISQKNSKREKNLSNLKVHPNVCHLVDLTYVLNVNLIPLRLRQCV